MIRGYEEIKLASVERYRAQVEELRGKLAASPELALALETVED